MAEKQRLTHDEYDALMYVKTVQAVLRSDRVQPVLKDRLKGIKYGPRDMGSAVKVLDRLSDALFDTVPLEQVKTLDNNMNKACIHIGVRSTRKFDKSDYGMVLSWDQLNALREAAQEKCVMCSRDVQAQRSCPLAKLLDALPGERNENARGCGYYGI